MCSRLLRMWEVPYWSTVLLCSRQVKTLQQARGAGDGQGHRGRGAEEVSGSGQVSTGAAWGQTPGMTTSVRLCCRTFETPKHAQHAPSAHNAQHAPFPTHLCDRLDRSFMFVSPTRRLACPVRSRATTSSTAGREGRNEAGRQAHECQPAAQAAPLESHPCYLPPRDSSASCQGSDSGCGTLTAVHLVGRQVADVLPLQVLPHLQIGARGVQQIGDRLQKGGQARQGRNQRSATTSRSSTASAASMAGAV